MIGPDSPNPLQLDFAALLTIAIEPAGVTVSAALLFGSQCPSITEKKYCSDEIFCCWSDPFGMAPGITLVFPFFFLISILFPAAVIKKLILQFAVLIGKMSFQLALYFDVLKPWNIALYVKIVDYHFGELFETMIQCEGCLGPLADTILQITFDFFEISLNPTYEFLKIGTLAIEPGFKLNLTNFNLWNAVIAIEAIFQISLQGFRAKIHIAPIPFGDLLVFGLPNNGTLIDVALTTTDQHFKVFGAVSLFNGFFVKQLIMEISPDKIMIEFIDKLGPLQFTGLIEGPAPMDSPDESKFLSAKKGPRMEEFLQRSRKGDVEKVKIPPVSKRTCTTTTRASQPPTNLYREQANCTTVKKTDNRSWYLDWADFPTIRCDPGEVLRGWSLDACDKMDQFQASMVCLGFIDIANKTKKYSNFVSVPDFQTFGVKDLVDIGNVSCHESFMMTSLSFGPAPDRPSNRRARGFHLECVEPDSTNQYQFVNGSQEKLRTECGKIVEETSIASLATLTSTLECPGLKVLRAFQFLSCLTEAKQMGYQVEFHCVKMAFVDSDPNSPANKKLPVSGFNFADVEGNRVQLTVCEGGELPKSSDVKVKNMTRVSKSESKVPDQMVCPPGEAMFSYQKDHIMCHKVKAIDRNKKQKWSDKFLVQKTPVTCVRGVVVGFKCSGRECTDKQILCQEFSEEGDTEVVFFYIEAKLSYKMSDFIDRVFAPAIRLIFEAAGAVLRAAGAVFKEMAAIYEAAAAALKSIQDDFNDSVGKDMKKLNKAKADVANDRRAVNRAQRNHDRCSWFECVRTLVALAAAELSIALKLTALNLIIALLATVALAFNLLLEAAYFALNNAKNLLEIAGKLFDALGAACEAMGDYIFEALKAGGDLMNELFEIREFRWGTRLSTRAYTVSLKVDMTLMGFDIAFTITLELEWEKIWNNLLEWIKALFIPGIGRPGTRLERSDVQAIYKFGADIMKQYQRSRGASYAIPEESVDAFEAIVDAIDDRVRNRGHSSMTRLEALAVDHFTNEALKKREAHALNDRMLDTFDTNLGLDALCATATERGGFQQIRQTNSVRRRTSGTEMSEMPKCLFQVNPKLTRVILDKNERLRGPLPDLQDDNHLEILSVTTNRLRGSWDVLLRKASKLELLHIQGTELTGSVSRSLWPKTLKSLSFVDNLFEIDLPSVFDSLQDLVSLRQVFWGRNLFVDQPIKEPQPDRVGQLSSLSKHIAPDFSVLYGVVTNRGWVLKVYDSCDPNEVSGTEIYRFPCSSQLALADLHQVLSDALNKITEFSDIHVDSMRIDNGKISFSARTRFLDVDSQMDILDGIRSGELGENQIGPLEARFGCTAGAIGSNCQYVCPVGWTRHHFNYEVLSDASAFPHCSMPLVEDVECSNVLGNAMDLCTEALYDTQREQACMNLLSDSQEVCRSCGFHNANAVDYAGSVSRSLSGKKCSVWQLVPSFTSPDAGNWKHNYCRNPDGNRSTAWCYTDEETQEWEHCNVGIPSEPKCRNEGMDSYDLVAQQFMEIFR